MDTVISILALLCFIYEIEPTTNLNVCVLYSDFIIGITWCIPWSGFNLLIICVVLSGVRDEQNSSPVKYDFETIHNIDIYGCELAPTVRAGMKSWNMSVQYWLASNVYRRTSSVSGPVRWNSLWSLWLVLRMLNDNWKLKPITGFHQNR